MQLSPSRLYWSARSTLAWALAAAAFAWFAVSDPDFLNAGNLYALMQIFSTLALVATGLALVMLAAEFDLSIAGVFPLAGLVAVRLADGQGAWTAFGLAVLVGAAVGALNGLLTGALRIPSLAVTVATMVLTIGMGYAVTNNEIVAMDDYQVALTITEPLARVLSPLTLVQLGLVLLACLYVRRSWRGRFLYAVGSNAARARASGLPVALTVTVVFVASGAFAAVGGALQGISLATGQAGSEDAFLLQCATAALVGGIALTGGRGSLTGVVGGALLLAVIDNGLGLQGVDSALVQLVNGAVLLAVVLADRPLTRVIDRRMRAQLPASGADPDGASSPDAEVSAHLVP